MALQSLSTVEIEEIFIRSAALVKAWGKTRLPYGKTLSDALTIGGVDFWDVISPSLAMGPVPDALGQLEKKPLITKSSLFVRKCREKVFKVGLPFIADSSGCRKWPQSPSILFLGFSHYMFRETLESVAKNISHKNEYSPVVLTDLRDTKRSLCSKNGLIFNSIWNHWTAETSAVAVGFHKEYEAAVGQPVNNDFIKNIVQGEEAFLFPSLENNFLWLFNIFLPRMMLYTAVAKHILSEHKPDLIVSPDVNDPRTRIYTLLGRSLKTPSLEVQLSYYLKKDIEWRFFVADHLAVTGEANRNIMAFHGIAPERMTITGSARYDNLLDSLNEEKVKKRRELGIPDNKIMLLFASQPYVYGASSHSPEARIKMIKDLFELMGVFGRCHLVVKPHPIENSPELKQLAAGHNNITFADKTLDIRELIGLGDAFITFCSNTTFDALARKKPTIVLSSVCSFFEESGAAMVARSKEDLSSHLGVIVNGIPTELQKTLDSSREKLIGQWLYRIDGLAKDRIEALVLKMARPL